MNTVSSHELTQFKPSAAHGHSAQLRYRLMERHRDGTERLTPMCPKQGIGSASTAKLRIDARAYYWQHRGFLVLRTSWDSFTGYNASTGEHVVLWVEVE